MKTLFLLLSLCGVNDSDGKSILQNTYYVESDVVSENVRKGTCKVYGNASLGNTPIEGAIISTLDRKKVAVTDSFGNYELLLSDGDTSIFFFKEGHDEIVIWNYNFLSQHAVKINFYGGVNMEMLEVDKPVIYLYSEEEKNVSLNLDFQGKMTFTYPELGDGWNVKVDQEGIHDLKGNKSYPYLFWEGISDQIKYETISNQLFADVVAKGDVLNYLQSSLTKLGLNSTEKADFITFWGPRMIKNNYVLVQFVVDEAYEENIAKITIDPEPESMRRIYMLFSGFEEYPSHIKNTQQELKSFDRNGFTLVEWGGSEIPLITYDL